MALKTNGVQLAAGIALFERNELKTKTDVHLSGEHNLFEWPLMTLQGNGKDSKLVWKFLKLLFQDLF